MRLSALPLVLAGLLGSAELAPEAAQAYPYGDQRYAYDSYGPPRGRTYGPLPVSPYGYGGSESSPYGYPVASEPEPTTHLLCVAAIGAPCSPVLLLVADWERCWRATPATASGACPWGPRWAASWAV